MVIIFFLCLNEHMKLILVKVVLSLINFVDSLLNTIYVSGLKLDNISIVFPNFLKHFYTFEMFLLRFNLPLNFVSIQNWYI